MALFASLFLFALFAVSLVSALSPVQVACLQLEEQLKGALVMPNDARYQAISEENWSSTAWAKPACIVQPVQPSDVQFTIQTLSHDQISIVVRLGGHSPNPLAANTDDGVLIDLTMLNKMEYFSEQEFIRIGAGLRWKDVYRHLDQYNVTVVGGRVLEVGVGGSILGCGLSYLSNLYGTMCDNVVDFEVVLGNGSIINANIDSNSDLFWALKGGGNNFGIVTTFTLSTRPIHMVWGGTKTYSLAQIPRLFNAVFKFQSSVEQDNHANFHATGPDASPAAFSDIMSIPTRTDNTRIQTFYEMMDTHSDPSPARWDWRGVSFKPNQSLYDEVAALMTSSPELESIKSLTSGILALGINPIMPSLVEAGRARGGNAVNLENVAQAWFVLDVGWGESKDDSTAHEATRSLMDKVQAKVSSHDSYLKYIFMNEASLDQEVIKHYGSENVLRLRRVQTAYDPDLVFTKLVSGGFKIL